MPVKRAQLQSRFRESLGRRQSLFSPTRNRGEALSKYLLRRRYTILATGS
jgi:hypothetical protein